ncbi:MAG TPA: hypothetical protein VK133_00185 [Amoebophilaceae bacterium]|nr:hypothetical protein [Amoebophilaceae bacterium]
MLAVNQPKFHPTSIFYANKSSKRALKLTGIAADFFQADGASVHLCPSAVDDLQHYPFFKTSLIVTEFIHYRVK